MQTVILVLVEVLIVIGLSRLVGLGCRWIKQPLVIGEIIAGIMLVGPSLFGEGIGSEDRRLRSGFSATDIFCL